MRLSHDSDTRSYLTTGVAFFYLQSKSFGHEIYVVSETQ